MNKLINVCVCVVLFFFIGLLFSKCKSPEKTNVLKSSFDINQSKENGVFIAEYVPSLRILNIEGRKVEIEEVWVENLWVYKNIKSDIEKRNGASIYIKFSSDIDLDELDFENNEGSYGSVDGKLTFELDNYSDTLKVTFLKNSEFPVTVSLYKKHLTQ